MQLLPSDAGGGSGEGGDGGVSGGRVYATGTAALAAPDVAYVALVRAEHLKAGAGQGMSAGT
jgi:hypothetical protein